MVATLSGKALERTNPSSLSICAMVEMMRGSVRMAVVIPVYNRIELLKKTVDCLFAQTLTDAEFIFVDDRSGKDVWEYLTDVSSADKRVKVIQKPGHLPQGCQASKNLALEHCESDFVTFLDSDDLMTPSCLQERCQFLLENSDVDLLVGKQAVLGNSSEQVFWVNVPSNEHDLDRFLDLAHPLDVPWLNGGSTIRLAKLKHEGIKWRPEFCWEDAAFHFECLCHGFKVRWMDRQRGPDAFYRLHDDTMGTDLWEGEGIQNAGRMMVWMLEELKSAAMHTVNRSQRLSRSFFHVCILRAVDLSRYSLSSLMVEVGWNGELLSNSERRMCKWFIRGRWLVRHSARLTFWVNRAARARLRCFFDAPKSTYASVEVETVVASSIDSSDILKNSSTTQV
jgi:glycosyltransferase involved in cell wall biosynthesis